MVLLSQPYYLGGTACNTTPVTFFASVSPAIGCISGYTWQFPPSWEFVSQSGNSITLRPSGTPADKAAIRATVNFSCGTNKTSGDVIPNFIDPVVTGPDLICSSQPYTVQNATGLAISWSTSNPSVVTINSSGVATRVSNASDAAAIGATLPCPAPVVPKNVWVGTPSQPGTMIGQTIPNIGHTERYLVTSGSQGASSHEWILPYNRGCGSWCWSINRYNTPLDIFANVGSTSGWMQMRGVNACGNGGVSKIWIAPTGTPGCNPCQLKVAPELANVSLIKDISVFPNPVHSELHVSFEIDENVASEEFKSVLFEKDILYLIHDSFGVPVKSYYSSKVDARLDINSLKPGLYLLSIYHGHEVKKERIVVSSEF